MGEFHREPFTYTWIENDDERKILAGSIPQLPEDIAILRSLDIKDIISLTRRDIRTYPDMDFSGIYMNPAPIPDGGVGDEKTMIQTAGWLGATTGAGYIPTYIHCRGGIGRTGMILQAYYILYRGYSLEQAKAKVAVRVNWQGNANATQQGSPQREWIDQLESSRERYLRLGWTR